MPKPRKKPSPATRKKDSARARAWQLAHPERARATNDRARKKHRNKYNERRREKYFRDSHRHTHTEITPSSFSIVNGHDIRRPTFRFVDTNGKEHTDKWETAEELARRYR